jgi:outer membrane protein OmpA-like peptidoglycan-associated protein
LTRRHLAARFLVAAGLLMACGARSYAQETEDPAISGMSRQMRMGIRYYERGDDLQAMDRFMDVLTNGDPSERSMANEYINLITHRMNTGEKGPAPQRPGETPLTESRVTRLPGGGETPAPAPRAAALAEPDEAPAGPVVERVASVPARPAASAVPAGPRAPEVAAEPDAIARPTTERPAAPPPAEDEAPRRRSYAEPQMTSGNRALMQKEIKAKLRQTMDQAVAQLREIDGVRLLMMSNGEPQAVAIPSPLLFQAGIAFQKDAAKILDALTKLVFSLAGAQVVILPEGTAIGDAKVLDMRRTMGVSSHLFSAGVAPPRVRVNLLNTQVDIPKPLMDFKGIVIVFVYNQPLPLTVESALGEEAGPPISLGIYPSSIRPDKGEGAVIEFSVQDPPAGLVSWKFQLLEPSEGGPTDLAPLQEVLGGNPVFHQIFWNGRRGYFGAPLPGGRYEAVLTAADSKGRQRTLHRWIQVQDTPGAMGGSAFARRPAEAAVTPAARAASAAPAAPAAAVAVSAVPAGAPPADLPADKLAGVADEPLIKEGPARKKARAAPAKRTPAKRKAAAKPKAKPAAEPQAEPSADDAAAAAESAAPAASPAAEKAGAAPAKPSKPASGSYELGFNKGTHQLTREGEKRLAQIADTVSYYPMESLSIQGSALPAEPNAATLAERRAKMVAGLLINKYQIDPKKIQVSSSVSEKSAGRVLVSFVKE